MSTPERRSQEPNEPQERSDMMVIHEFPGLQPEILLAVGHGKKIVIIESNAHASVATTLCPIIKQLTEAGTVVIAVPDQFDQIDGISELVNQPQVDSGKAGLIFLERASHANIEEVILETQAALDRGLESEALVEALQQRFAFPDGKRPEPRDPRKALWKHHQSLIDEGLGGVGLTDPDGNWLGDMDDGNEDAQSKTAKT